MQILCNRAQFLSPTLPSSHRKPRVGMFLRFVFWLGSNLSAEISSKSLDIIHKSLHVRESKTVLDSGFHAVDSGFQVLDSRFFVSGTWIPDSKQLLDEVFVISRIIKVEVGVISRSQRLSDNFPRPWLFWITKSESNNCFIIIHGTKKKKKKWSRQ